VHGPNWVETPDRERARIVEPIVARDGWVIDGTYQRKLGTLVLDAADIVVWLDLPLHVWLPRLLRRTMRRLRGEEELWNGNKERFRTAFVGRNSLFFHALRMHVERRRRYPAELAPYTRAPPQPGAGRGLSQLRPRDVSSATQARTRSPIQIGVRTT
jgi:adenylate kinase family enzyme